MLPEIRKCAEKQDIKGLRYIFMDALDVDPTFDKYREDYEYCKKIGGLFDTHQELSGLNQNEAGWNAGYWERLKTDLMKNFSEKRYAHMIQVAKVVYAAKIERLMKERGRASAEAVRRTETEAQGKNARPIQGNVRSNVVIREGSGAVSKNEMEERRLAERRRELAEENRRREAEQRAQQERIEAARRAAENNNARNRAEGSGSKKWLGIVLAIAVMVVILIVLMLR